MSEQNSSPAPQARDLDYAQARLAYSIIETLLEQTRAANDLIALMAQTLDEDTQRALTNTPIWTAYLESRRGMDRARREIEELSEIMKHLADDEAAQSAFQNSDG